MKNSDGELEEYLHDTLRESREDIEECKTIGGPNCYAAGHAAGRIEVARAIEYWHARGTLKGFEV